MCGNSVIHSAGRAPLLRDGRDRYSPQETHAHLIDDGLQGHLQIVHAGQLHGFIYALGGERVPPENGVGVPAEEGELSLCDVPLTDARTANKGETQQCRVKVVDVPPCLRGPRACMRACVRAQA